MGLGQPGNGVGLVLALGDRRVARPAVLDEDLGDGLRRQFEPRLGVALAALDFLGGRLAVGDRVEPLHLQRHLAIGDRLHLERMEAAEISNLLEG